MSKPKGKWAVYLPARIHDKHYSINAVSCFRSGMNLRAARRLEKLLNEALLLMGEDKRTAFIQLLA